ncbi:SDR family oxidoreductase [Uliginosibacterium sp. sgz301328]|uniref:SDR family oxidoreductase n=1 Tax=Uliginosibacterium sp. sgz301328 TaxID=3243764 RepID=UPI00359E662B
MTTSETINPPQHQSHRPGSESEMTPAPQSEPRSDRARGKLDGKVAIITGGDSGIGRAVAVAFAREGAQVAIVYLEEEEDASETVRMVEAEGARCLRLAGDMGDTAFASEVIEQTLEAFGKIDVLVNNAGEQHPQKSIEEIDAEQLENTFRTNVFSMFYLTQAALPHLREGASIINTASVTAYRGNPKLLDYAASKGAIVAFTRSLSHQLVPKGIRVNAVAPGPVWTPLIPSTFTAEEVASFGGNTPMKRPGQPAEIAPCFVFLACEDSSYMSGQVLHPNGGEVVNG